MNERDMRATGRNFNVVRKGWGAPRVVSTFRSRAEAERSAAELNRQAMRDFKEGRIMYDVPEFFVEAAPVTGDIAEDRRRGPRVGHLTRSTARPGTAVRVADSDSMYRGMTGTVVTPDARRLAALDAYNRRFLKGEGTVLVETPRGELFVIHARALERLGEAITRAMARDSRRGPRRQR